MKKTFVMLFALLFLTAFCACTERSDEATDKAMSKPELNKTESFSESSGSVESVGNESSEVSADENEETFPETSDENDNESSNESNVENEESSIPDDEDEDEDRNETSTPPDDEEDDEPIYDSIGDAELLPSGCLLYNGAIYLRTSYSAEMAQSYAKVYARYAELFPNTRISVINPPLSSINIVNPLVANMVNDQGYVLDMMQSHIYGNVNFVNLKNTFLAHRGEYLYFKSDWHWTQLGAYYAYSDFAKSIGLTPTPLGAFKHKIVTDEFIGALAGSSGDDRVYSFYDTIHAYIPRKNHTMTITNGDESATYNTCIHTYIKNYSCFIVGDNAITTIKVPENDQNKTALVIKESSANAFVPFLTEHYGEIIVIDPRHIDIDIREMVKEQGIDDIIFFSMASTSNRYDYCCYYERMIGFS